MTWKDEIIKSDRKKFRELQKHANTLADYLEDLDRMETKSFNEVTVNLKRLESTLDTEYNNTEREAREIRETFG